MRSMDHSNLPRLVNTTNWTALQQEREMPSTQQHSRQSSSQSTTSDSSPTSPTWSARGKFSSSTSSLSSTPPHYDYSPVVYDSPVPNKKTVASLPDVEEDPMERDQCDFPEFSSSPPRTLSDRNSQTSQNYSWPRPNSFYATPIQDIEMTDDFATNAEHLAKRRKSGESSLNDFATRLISRVSSISRRKRASTSAEKRADTLPASFFGRSSSFRLARTSTIKDRKEFDGSASDTQFPTHLEMHDDMEVFHEEDSGSMLVSSPLGILYPADHYFREDFREDFEDVNAEPMFRSSTPLLPPLMDCLKDTEPIQSPLQSPSVAASKPPSGTSTPTITPPIPQIFGQISPSLTAQTSITSFNRSRATTLGSTEIPPLLIADQVQDDEWAEKLGHANFRISPEPYTPILCDEAACKRLLADWALARAEYAKHLALTEMHFGGTSRTFKLTKEKWTEIEAQWKRSSDETAQRAAKNGDSPFSSTMIEPAPVAIIPPIIDDPRLNPGDDMVGPMERQTRPQMPNRPRTKDKFLKLFIGLGRSSSAPSLAR